MRKPVVTLRKADAVEMVGGSLQALAEYLGITVRQARNLSDPLPDGVANAILARRFADLVREHRGLEPHPIYCRIFQV